MDNKQIAHDIAIALLPQILEETEDTICIYNHRGEFGINARNIRKAYEDIYSSVLTELSGE